MTTKPSIGRRSVLASASLIGASAFSRRAGAAQPEFSYKFGNSLADSHPFNVRMIEAAKAIFDETKGRLEIKVFPNSQLGGDTDMVSQVRYGALEFMETAGLILSTLVPTAAINGIGFAFSDYPTVWKAMDGDLGALIRAAITKANLYPFERVWDNGFRQITSSTKPINEPRDLDGFRIRVPVSPLYTSLFSTLGAAPTGINLAETYSALQTHIVDGQENPLAVVDTTKLYEVQKYCAMTNHVWDGLWVFANPRKWQALPADMRDIVQRRFNEGALRQRADVEQLNNSLRTSLQAKGLTFTEPQPGPFKEKLRQKGFYADWRQKFGDDAWKVLEKYAGTLS